MRPVTVQFRKNPDVTHRGFQGSWLGDDEWGDWIGLPAGSDRWKGEEDMGPTGSDTVFCAPRGEWWHLHYNGSSSNDYTHFVDIATPPNWLTDNRYEMIDLDLDVALRTDGTLEIQDEDEFEIHQIRYGYTDEMIRRAAEETYRVATLLRERREPFFDVAEAWLAKVAP